jgi:hypothetical protein
VSTVPVKRKQTRPRKQQPKQIDAIRPFQGFECDAVTYTFDVPIDEFKQKAFTRQTGIGINESWAAVIPTKNPLSEYHAHFNGRIESKRVSLTIEYFAGPVERRRVHPKQDAETLMAWIGSFCKQESVRALATANFEKSHDKWRSRFNLPFKVTMLNAEVGIDGVSMLLPKNEFRAMKAWLTRLERALIITVTFGISLDFSRFNIEADLKSFNESLKMIAEELPS